MQAFASLKGRPRGEKLLDELRAKGRPTPEVLRVRELMIGPASAPDKDGAILRTSFEFEDGTIRAMHLDVADIIFLMLEDDSSLVTEHWKHGDVLRNPPRAREASAPPAAPGVSVAMLGTVLTPLTERIGGEVAKLRKALAEQKARADAATAKLADADTKIATLERRASRQAEHLANLESKVRKLRSAP